METAISQFSQLPQTKLERKAFVELVVNEILSGSRDPIEVEIYLKNIEETISEIRKNDEVKNLLLNEANKYNEKTFDFAGNKITITSRSSYDFSECNHSELNKINENLKVLNDRKKQIETELKFLSKPVADAETGEIINLPKKSTTEFLTIKLK